jgi:hypothetical protein
MRPVSHVHHAAVRPSRKRGTQASRLAAAPVIHRGILARTATIALAAAALAAPTASARPADARPAVSKPAAAEQHQQARRSVDANGFPTRPVIDRSPASSQPDATSQAPADPGTNWATIAIGIAGSLLAFGAIAGIANRARGTRRPRITA